MLDTLSNPLLTFTAKDTKRDEQTKRIEMTAFSDTSGGLSKVLSLAVDARVILTKNIDVSDGLVNSASGTVTGFLPQPTSDDSYSPKFILVKFDDERIGRKKRLESKAILRDMFSTPIERVEIPIPVGNSNKISGKRIQFPLAHAWAVTIHKEQGKTEDALVLSCKGSFHAGQFYTAISRTKTLDGLFILDQVQASKIKVNLKSLQEIQRMRKESQFTSPIPLTVQKSTDYYFKVNFFNVNSLLPHVACLIKDQFIEQAHITCLAETWLIPSDEHPELTDYYPLRCDYYDKQKTKPTRRGGLLMYVHYDLYLVKQILVSDVCFEYQLVILSPSEDVNIRFAVLAIYRNPKLNTQRFLSDLEKILLTVPQGLPIFVCGDFNIDYLKKTSCWKILQQLMRYHGFQQLITSPTHRKGGLIDHIYSNVISEDIVFSTFPTYYSDHLLLSMAIPKKCLPSSFSK